VRSERRRDYHRRGQLRDFWTHRIFWRIAARDDSRRDLRDYRFYQWFVSAVAGGFFTRDQRCFPGSCVGFNYRQPAYLWLFLHLWTIDYLDYSSESRRRTKTLTESKTCSTYLGKSHRIRWAIRLHSNLSARQRSIINKQ
jgi:hypothetical protein